MNNSKTKPATDSATDPATLAHQAILKRQRRNMQRNLLKRRRRKSGQ